MCFCYHRLIHAHSALLSLSLSLLSLTHTRTYAYAPPSQMNSEPPPVCKIMNFRQHSFEIKRKKKQQQSTASTVGALKEIRLGVRIAEHDLRTKLDKMQDLLKRGHRVKLLVSGKGEGQPSQILVRSIYQSIHMWTHFSLSLSLCFVLRNALFVVKQPPD